MLSIRLLYKPLLLLVTCQLLSGCAGSMFISYPSHLQEVRTPLAAGQPQPAIAVTQKQVGGQSVQLDQAELGRVQQIAGNYQDSLTAYQKAIDQVQSQQLNAKIQVTKIASNTAAILSNDNAIPYQLQGYETVLLYGYQSLNYLALNQFANGLVSIRQTLEEQQWVQQQHDKALTAAQQKADKEGWHFNPNDYADRFSATMQAAATVKSSFENGFVYYLAALAFQASGDLNNAVVSIKNALNVAPNNTYVRQQLLSLLVQRDGTGNTQLLQYQRDFNLPTPTLPNNAGQLAVIYEQGLVPPMSAIQIPIPVIGLGQLQMYSFPIYAKDPHTITPLTISLGNTGSYQTQVITNIYTLAAKSLSENYLMIFVRETLRFIAKTALTNEGNNQGNGLLGLAAQIYSVATSSPDLRSWLTLPDNIQVMQQYLPAGTYPITLSTDGQSTHTLKVTILPGKALLLWVIHIGQTFTVKEISL